MGYIFKKAEVSDVEKLDEIHQSWEYYVEIHGIKLEKNHFYHSITEGDKPPVEGASKDNFHIFMIYQENDLVGFIEMYAGYPNSDDLWISLFEIEKSKRRFGHGNKIILQLENEISRYNCRNLALAVDLKNFRGMKFWTKVGFKEIIGVHGDDAYGKDKFASISLRKRILS